MPINLRPDTGGWKSVRKVKCHEQVAKEAKWETAVLYWEDPCLFRARYLRTDGRKVCGRHLKGQPGTLLTLKEA